MTLYARALARVWKGIREPWTAATALLERETERVETAAGHGALPEVMGGIHHRASLDGELWHLHVGERLPLRLPQRGLTIAPVLGGPGCALLMFPEEALLSQILYPLPGVLRMLDGNGACRRPLWRRCSARSARPSCGCSTAPARRATSRAG